MIKILLFIQSLFLSEFLYYGENKYFSYYFYYAVLIV
jgi:hypothetical protein